ncbi:MAG: PAS domain S-box protein [Candidatus Natronoplasma sp.]
MCSERSNNLAEEGTGNLEKPFENLDLGNHLCCIYRDREKYLLEIALFVLTGLEQDEKCVYVVDDRKREQIIDFLHEQDIDIEKYLETGQFEFLTRKETYLKDGYFDPDEMVVLLKKMEEEALENGYDGVRVTGEMTWVLSDLPGTERLMEYEMKLNKFLPESDTIGLCQYNEERFPPEILIDVIYTHPKILLHDSIFENPYYLPPDVFLSRLKGDVDRGYYESIKEDIIQRGKLKKRERLADTSLEKASIEVFWLNPAGKVIYSNETVKERLDYSKEELNEMYVWDVDPEYPKERREEFWNELKDKKTRTFESEHGSKDGEVFPVEITSQYVKIGEDEYEFAFAKDISERKEAKEDLKEKKRELENLLSNLPGMAYRSLNNREWTMKFVSEGCKKLTGYEPEDLIDSREVKWSDLIKPEDRERVWDVLQEALEEKEPFEVTYRIRTRKGDEKWVSEHGNGIYEDGDVKYLEGIIEDMTEKKEADEEIRELTQFREKIIQDANIWLNVLDDDGNVLVWNKAAEDISGYSKEEVVGNANIWEWLYPEESQFEDITAAMEEILEGKIVEDYKTTIECKDGSEKIISWTSHPLQDDEGDIIGSIALGRDVTTQREAEERRDFLNTMLRQDLQSKYQIIQGYLQLINESDLSEKHRKFFEKAERISGEANSILRLAKKLEEIERTDWSEKKDLRKVLEHVMEDISDLVERKKVEIIDECSENICAVEGNYSLNNLISQLLRTRIKISGCEHIKISVTEKEEGVELKLEDDGERLPEEIKKLLFGDIYKGFTTGIGGVRYYIIKQIAKHNGIDIIPEDSDMGGERFKIYLRKA